MRRAECDEAEDERQRVDAERERRAEVRDDDARGDRTRGPAQRPAERACRVRLGQQIRRYELGDDGGVRRESERGRAAKDQRADIEVVDAELAKKPERRNGARYQRADRVSGEDDPPPRRAIGDRAADEQK